MRFLVIAVGVIVAGLAGFLVELAAGQDGEPLKVTDVEGLWSATDGGRLTVRPDGSAELEGVRDPKEGCGRSNSTVGSAYPGPATWEFDTYPDESPGIRFDYRGIDTGQKCSVYLSITGSDKHGAKGFLPHRPEQQYARGAAQAG
ncbi:MULTISPECIES: hypothetical protein [unclassified Streptomyces]|uniref:hypothetical protein n=1 Tax=unclassified Streptomyces TaxID=2593676 RepID=UPI003804FE4C